MFVFIKMQHNKELDMQVAPTTAQKVIIVSLYKTNLSAVVQARIGDDDFGHYFSTSQLTETAKQLIDIWVGSLAKKQGRTITPDADQLKDTMTNLTHHFMSFCADSEQHEAVVFDGFNDQNGEAIKITVKLTRSELMNFNKGNAP